MCGIVGYVDTRGRVSHEPVKVILQGLKRLEERGYDQVGLAVIFKNNIDVVKSVSKIDALKNTSVIKKLTGEIAMGHTRWATHGKPKMENCHPHYSNDNKWSVCHNGVIENYAKLKESLVRDGYHFRSDTDTEVIPMLFQKNFDTTKNWKKAFCLTIRELKGSYALTVMTTHSPNMLICVKKKSPMVIGIGTDALMVSSDEKPLVGFCNHVIHLDDDEIVLLKKTGSYSMMNLDGKIYNFPKNRLQKLTLSINDISKGAFKTFMEKEIFEQEQSILNCMKGRIDPDKGTVVLNGLNNYMSAFKNARHITILGCGTSYHAGMIGRILFEKYAKISTVVDIASEWCYRDPLILPGDVVIGISQSGETADTNQALEYAKSRGAIIFGICNSENSQMTKITDAGVYLHIGKETSVASTKAFTAQVNVLILMVLTIAEERGTIGKEMLQFFLRKQSILPPLINETLKLTECIKKIAEAYKDANNALFLGRGLCYPVALEGALKLKEISCVHAEGISAPEMKHGPIALINEKMPVIVIATDTILFDKILSNIKQVQSRGGKIIAIVLQGDTRLNDIAEHIIQIPSCDEIFQPIIASIPLQLFALYSAQLRGKNVDQPENLAKTVTVE